jgi:hypothetical protein
VDLFKVYEILRPSGWRWSKVQPEAAICLQLANMLRASFLEGRLKCICFHIPNETVDRRVTRSLLLKKDMLTVCGAPDYMFATKDKILMVEVKTPKGVLSPNQLIFKLWCESLEIPYVVIRSSAEAEQLLIDHGLLLSA